MTGFAHDHRSFCVVAHGIAMTSVSKQKIDKQGFADFCLPLIGMPVNHVWRGYGSAIFLEFGKLRPTIRLDGKRGNPSGEMSLMVEWSWRIEGVRSILCGSWSDEPLWPKTFAKLKKAKVTEVSLLGRLNEVDVKLSNKIHVVSFCTTEGSPQWTIFNRKADSWLTVRDGSLCVEQPVRKS
jgi:hypothetical protein